jgi:hypothetical protein
MPVLEGEEQSMVHVDAYERADGTKVRSHSRWAAGARGQMTVLALVALVIVGFSGTGASGEGGGGKGKPAPRPQSTSVYPVKFRGWKNPAPRPTPTVSYPIRWGRSR